MFFKTVRRKRGRRSLRGIKFTDTTKCENKNREQIQLNGVKKARISVRTQPKFITINSINKLRFIV